jgi:membrane-associated phospholipid phosphatase
MLKFTTHLIRSFSLLIVSCIFCYFFLDKPIARLMYQVNHIFIAGPALDNASLMTNITAVAYLIIVLLMMWYAFERIYRNKNTRLMRCVCLSSLGVGIAFFVKTNLQFLFGRIGPRYDDTSALVFSRNDALYGFHFFQGGGSFPSGHMCVFTAALIIPCYFYPKLKWVFYTLLGLLGFVLIFCNYHFLSDVIAGTYLGAFIGITLLRLNNLNASRSDRAETVFATTDLQNQ